MFIVNDDKSIYLTRGDIATIPVDAEVINGRLCVFKAGDIVRLIVIEKKNHKNIVFTKDIVVERDSHRVNIFLSKDETTMCEVIDKHVDYWYEIKLNPDTAPQTLIGYDVNGPKIFRLFPNGDNSI